MASTTSAAASMLLSSSTSRSNGLNFHSNPKQFYLQNSSLSPSPNHPTITLDLTNSTPSSSHFNRFSSSSYSSVPKFASSTLSNEPNWSNGFFGYGNTNRSHVRGLNIDRSPIENDIFRSYAKNKKTPVAPHQQQDCSSSIAAAMKAITDNPSFQSALAAALSSIIGKGSGNSAQKLRLGEHFPVASGGYCLPAPKGNANACAASYFNKTTDSLMILPASLQLVSPSRNDVSSPADSKDRNS